MKLECPSCHQKYRLTNQSIPADKTAVPCRVCAKPIPLTGRSAAVPSPAPPTQSVSCGYCGKTVAIDAVQATEAETIPCPSCHHPIVPSPRQTNAPAAATAPFEGVHLKCSQCQQTYTLNRAKIPANAASATCKACGNKIPIPGSLGKHHRPNRQAAGAQAVAAAAAPALPAAVKIDEPISITAVSATKKPWSRAILALLLAALIGFGIWFGGGYLLDLFKTGWEVLIESKPRPTMKTPSGTFSSKPLMAMRLNTPLVLHAVKGRIAENSPHRKSMAALNAVGLERVEVFMLPQSELLVVPALFIQGREIRHLEKLVAGYNLIEKAIHRVAAGQYVVDPAALGQKYGKDYPAIPYTIWFHDNTVLLAPEVLMQAPEVTLARLIESRVSDFAGTLTSGRQAGAVAVKIPRTLESDWPVKLRQNPVLQADPRLAMTAGMGSSVLVQLGDALGSIDMLGANLTVVGKNRQRKFHYRQRFRGRSAANKFTEQLKSGAAPERSSQWLAREMMTLFNDRRIEYTFTLDGRDLDVQVEWLPDDDQLIMNALIRAMFGKVIESAPITVATMAPSTGAVETVTMDMPQFSLAVDRGQLDGVIPQAFQAGLFPGQYWDGKEPHMNVDLDTILFPNNALAQTTYEILAVKSPQGENIMRRLEQVDQHNLRPGEPSPGFVAVNVKAGTAADSLGSADIRFHLKVPTRLQPVEFTRSDAAGTVRVAGKIPVKLKRIEKDVVEISFKDNPGVFVFAFNAAGNALAVNESLQSANTISRRFHGIIARVMVLVIEEQLEMPFDLSVDLNRGQAFKLAHRPETPVRKRLDNTPLRPYRSFNPATLDKLSVTWHQGANSDWFDHLSIDLPAGPFHGRADWEVNFFGRNNPVYFSGNPANTGQRISFTLEKGALQKANAAFGRVAMTLSTNIERLHFVKSAEKTPIIQKLPSDKIVTVIFDQNEVTLTPFDEATVQIIAYDSNNRRLKRDSYSQNKGSMRKLYFWGIPTSVDVDIAEGHIEKTLDFDIVKRPVDQKAYDTFKQQVATRLEVVATLKQIVAARMRDRNRYGDDVAGLYYLYNRKQKTPMRLIDRAVAHSDPAGKKRFGYALQPYKGYYFKVLAGVEVNGRRGKFAHDKRAHSVYWDKGLIKTVRYQHLPTVAAIPVNKSQPTFFEDSGRVFMKALEGEELKYHPDDPPRRGWIEATMIGE